MALTWLDMALTRVSPAKNNRAQHGTDTGVTGMMWMWTWTNMAHVCH